MAATAQDNRPGELKINHQEGSPDKSGAGTDQVHTVHIDRNGNLSYDQ
jgi:hypothetical protein